MNEWIAVLSITLVMMLIMNTKLRWDLCKARWSIYKLSFLIVFQNENHIEYWAAPDPMKIVAYAEGQITLEELFKHIREKYG